MWNIVFRRESQKERGYGIFHGNLSADLTLTAGRLLQFGCIYLYPISKNKKFYARKPVEIPVRELKASVCNFYQNFNIHTLRCDFYIHDEQVHRLASLP